MSDDKNKQEREAFVVTPTDAETMAEMTRRVPWWNDPGRSREDAVRLALEAYRHLAALSQPQAGGTLSDSDCYKLWDEVRGLYDSFAKQLPAYTSAILARSTADASNAVTGQGMTRQQILDAVEPFSDDYMHQHYSDDIVQMVRERLLAASAAPAPTMHCETREEVDRALDWIAPSAPAEPAPTDEEIEDFLAARMTNEGRVPMIATIREALAKWGNAAPAPAAQADEQITCIRKLFDGGLFDLTDSPKSFMENVIRIVGQQSAASEPAAQAMLDGDAIFAAMYARDPYWDAQGRSSAAAVRLALDCIRQQSAAPAEPAQADGLTIDLMHESYHQIIDAYVAAFAPPPEVMGNDIIGHVCKMIADAATPAEPVYQVWYVDNGGSWCDVTKAKWDAHPWQSRRIMYRSPADAASEADKRDEMSHTLECAVENMRLAGELTDAQIESRWRLAYKLAEYAKDIRAAMSTQAHKGGE